MEALTGRPAPAPGLLASYGVACFIIAVGTGVFLRGNPWTRQMPVSAPGWSGTLGQLPLPQALAAGAGAIVLRPAGDRGVERLAFDIEGRGPATIVRGERPDPADVVPVMTSPWCRATAPGAWRCHVPLVVAATPGRVSIGPGVREAIVVTSLDARRLKHTATIAQRDNGLLLAVVVALAAIPLAWLTLSRPRLHTWVLAGSGFMVLAAVTPFFALGLAVLLMALHAAGVRGGLQGRRAGLVVGLFAVAAALAVGKYGALGGLGAFGTASPGVALGVSYVVIRLIDLLLRWHRGEQRDVPFADFLAYVLFPSTLPAGPIQTIDQYRGGRLARMSSADVAAGLSRLLLGAAKKVVIADYLLAHALFTPGGLFERSTLDPGSSTWPVLAATLVTSFLYAYADFSAYSDMAIGLGRLYGHRIPENFNWPVLASSLRDFWRRWHMTLSSWCMRNIYFPLVLGTRRVYQPLFAVMLAVGLWHAFAASWFAWALHHGAGLTILAVLERHRRKTSAPALLRRALGTVATIAFVVAGHGFVLCGDFPTGLHIYARFLTLGLWP